MLTFSLNKNICTAMLDNDLVKLKIEDAVSHLDSSPNRRDWLGEFVLKSIGGDDKYTCIDSFITTANKLDAIDNARKAKKLIPIVNDIDIANGVVGVLEDTISSYTDDYDIELERDTDAILADWYKVESYFFIEFGLHIRDAVLTIINFGKYHEALQKSKADLQFILENDLLVATFYKIKNRDANLSMRDVVFYNLLKKHNVFKLREHCAGGSLTSYKNKLVAVRNLLKEGYLDLLLEVISNNKVWTTLYGDTPCYIDSANKFFMTDSLFNSLNIKEQEGD